jgi:hypothetical protein
MGRRRVLLSREGAALMARAQVEIGRRLREAYDLAQPVSDRLTELVGKIEGFGVSHGFEIEAPRHKTLTRISQRPSRDSELRPAPMSGHVGPAPAAWADRPGRITGRP